MSQKPQGAPVGMGTAGIDSHITEEGQWGSCHEIRSFSDFKNVLIF